MVSVVLKYELSGLLSGSRSLRKACARCLLGEGHARAACVEHNQLHGFVGAYAAVNGVDHFGQYLACLYGGGVLAVPGFDPQLSRHYIDDIGHGVAVPVECGFGGDGDFEYG